MAGGKYGCTWKVVSGKFQLAQNNKMTFIVDSDTEKAANEDEEEEEEEIDVINNLADVKIANSDNEAEPEDAEETEDAKEEPKVATTTRGRKGAASKK